MRRTLTVAAVLGVFVVAPAGSAFASAPVEKPGNSYGNCGVNARWGVTAENYNDLTPDGGYGGQVSLRGNCYDRTVVVDDTPAEGPSS